MAAAASVEQDWGWPAVHADRLGQASISNPRSVVQNDLKADMFAAAQVSEPAACSTSSPAAFSAASELCYRRVPSLQCLLT